MINTKIIIRKKLNVFTLIKTHLCKKKDKFDVGVFTYELNTAGVCYHLFNLYFYQNSGKFMRKIAPPIKLGILLFICLIGTINAWAIPLLSETSDLVLVCRGYPHWPHYKNVDEDNAIILNYQTDKVYWYGDITNKRLFNELNVVDEKREHTLFGGTKEIIDIALALPGEPVHLVGRITKSSRNSYISVTIGDYSFRARCIFYSPADYNETILPQFTTGS